MLEKCPECGENLKDNSIVVWKCNNCSKSFKGSSQFLQNLQKKKEAIPGKSVLKCNNCGNWLDDGKEDISVKCSSCGNVYRGYLGYLRRKNLIKCPECGRENVSNTAVSCPACGFAIREFFYKKLNKKENCQQIHIKSEVVKIRTNLDEFYIREGAYWYNKSKRTYFF